MQTGYYNAIGSMVTQFNKLDIVSNNLANLNTNGFKQDNAIVADFHRLYKEKRDNLPLANNTYKGSSFFNRTYTKVPQVSQIYTNFSTGGMRHTGNTLDLAIKNKESFFVLQDKDNNKILTKNGAFSFDGDGYIVNNEGLKLLDSSLKPIKIDNSKHIVIDDSGNIYLNNKKQTSLYIASVENPDMLSKIGNSNFFLNGQKLNYEGKSGYVASGFLEQSNVNAVSSMTSLIAINRLLEMSQKVANSQMDDMNNELINKVAVNK